MQVITSQDGKLQSRRAGMDLKCARGFVTGLNALDELAPNQSFARGAVHELLYDPAHPRPKMLATILARAASEETWGGGREKSKAHTPRPTTLLPTFFSDPRRQLYPPALAAMGIDLERLFVLRPQNQADEMWAVAECLRCRGVGAVVAEVSKLSRVEARRLQLAAERGGTVGILMRPLGKTSTHYAAATRWLIRPWPGERSVQRWAVQLIHGHGGRIGQTVFLECCRETHTVRAIEKLVHRSLEAQSTARASA